MKIGMDKEYSPSFQKIIVLKRAEKAFSEFRQKNSISKEQADIFNRSFELESIGQKENPVNIIIDYIKSGKNRAKKLVIALAQGKKKITPPKTLRNGIDNGFFITYGNNDGISYTTGVPWYLQQIYTYGYAANSIKNTLSKQPFKNCTTFLINDF